MAVNMNYMYATMVITIVVYIITFIVMLIFVRKLVQLANPQLENEPEQDLELKDLDKPPKTTGGSDNNVSFYKWNIIISHLVSNISVAVFMFALLVAI